MPAASDAEQFLSRGAEELFERALADADELGSDEIETMSQQVAQCQASVSGCKNDLSHQT